MSVDVTTEKRFESDIESYFLRSTRLAIWMDLLR